MDAGEAACVLFVGCSDLSTSERMVGGSAGCLSIDDPGSCGARTSLDHLAGDATSGLVAFLRRHWFRLFAQFSILAIFHGQALSLEFTKDAATPRWSVTPTLRPP